MYHDACVSKCTAQQLIFFHIYASTQYAKYQCSQHRCQATWVLRFDNHKRNQRWGTRFETCKGISRVTPRQQHSLCQPSYLPRLKMPTCTKGCAMSEQRTTTKVCQCIRQDETITRYKQSLGCEACSLIQRVAKLTMEYRHADHNSNCQATAETSLVTLDCLILPHTVLLTLDCGLTSKPMALSMLWDHVLLASTYMLRLAVLSLQPVMQMLASMQLPACKCQSCNASTELPLQDHRDSWLNVTKYNVQRHTLFSASVEGIRVSYLG